MCEVVNITKPPLTCQVCGGPIQTGELAHVYLDPEGVKPPWACHWFTSTCEADREEN